MAFHTVHFIDPNADSFLYLAVQTRSTPIFAMLQDMLQDMLHRFLVRKLLYGFLVRAQDQHSRALPKDAVMGICEKCSWSTTVEDVMPQLFGAWVLP